MDRSDRRAHQLTKLKERALPRYCIYFDTESNVVDDVHTPYLLCATFCDYKRKKDYSYDRIYAENDGTPPRVKNFWEGADLSKYRPIKEFWTDVDEFAKPGKPVLIYAHNVGYDINAVHAIDGLVVDHGYKVISFFDKGSYIMKLQKEVGKAKKTITFLGTGNYFPGKLEKIAKTFGFPHKKEFDFDKGTFLESVPYCQRDVEICKVAMEGFRKFLTHFDLGPMRPTIAGQAFATFCYKFMDEDKPIFVHDNPKATALERDSYHGGRVECFKIGCYQGDFYKLDVNSMYPAAMIANKFPTKLLKYRSRCSLAQIKRFLKQGRGVIAKVKIREDAREPHIPYQSPTKLIFPGGEFTVTLCTPELEYCIKKGIVLEVYDACIYQMEYIFKDYVEFFYTRRDEAKANNDSMMSNMFKLFLNSLYGKFGQKSDVWDRVGDCDPKAFKVETIVKPGGEVKTVRYLGGSIFEHGKEQEAFNAFCAIASHVTSYARQILAGFMQTAGRENIYYCDTDSLFTNKTGYDRIKAAGGIDNKLLGKLKLEGNPKEMYFHGPKDYELDGKFTLKGIGKNDIGMSDIRTHRTLYYCKQWPKLNGQLRKGPYTKYKNINIVKELKRKYRGGWIESNGDVTPFILDNDMILPH